MQMKINISDLSVVFNILIKSSPPPGIIEPMVEKQSYTIKINYTIVEWFMSFANEEIIQCHFHFILLMLVKLVKHLPIFI